MAPEDRLGASAIFQLEGALVSEWSNVPFFAVSILKLRLKQWLTDTVI